MLVHTNYDFLRSAIRKEDEVSIFFQSRDANNPRKTFQGLGVMARSGIYREGRISR
jgi:hypothetical protein